MLIVQGRGQDQDLAGVVEHTETDVWQVEKLCIQAPRTEVEVALEEQRVGKVCGCELETDGPDLEPLEVWSLVLVDSRLKAFHLVLCRSRD